MSFADCIAEIQAAAGREMDPDEIERLASRLDREIKRQKAEGGIEDLTAAVMRAAEDEAQKIDLEARVAKRNAALNIVRRQEIDEFLAGFDDPGEGLQALLVGVARNVTGARQSIDARGKAIETEYEGALLSELRNADLERIVKSRAMDDDIAREMWEIRDGGNPGITKNAEARQIADIFAKYKESARVRLNRAGAFIGKIDGHISQSHDMVKVRRAQFDAWAGEILPRLDHDRTFEGADPMEFMQRVFDDIVTGEHIGGAKADGKFSGPSNLGALVSRARVLHFKSADDYLAYHRKFGAGSLIEGVFHGLRHAARDIAIMERLGPNPRLMFEAVQKKLKDANRGDLAAFDKLNSGRFENFFAEVSGEVNIPGNITGAKVGQVIRAVQSMSKLGGAVISSVTDVGNRAINARYQGRGLLSDYGDAVASVFRGRGAGETRDIADSLGVGFEGTIGSVLSRFSAEDNLPGKTSKALNLYFRANGLAWWTDAQKTGFSLMSSYDLAKQSGMAFSDLNARQRSVLEQYGIGDTEWSLIRNAVHRAEDGRGFITPDAVAKLPLEDMDAGIADWISRQTRRGDGWPARLKARREQYRQELSTRLRSYFVEEADFAVPTPGARERAILRQGTRPGTIKGEALRYIMQFKAFPVTVLTKTGGRLTDGRPLDPKSWDVPGIVHAALSLTTLGYLAMSMKEAAKGRSPRDPLAPETWTAAFVQGGGAGIYGDFLFGEFNRFGRSPLETVAGPTAGSAAELISLWAKLRTGDDTAASAFRFALSNTPFLNLFYARAALDYLAFYQVQELLNPGYLRRYERRVRRDNDQSFFLPPSRVVPRGGGEPQLANAFR